MKDQRTLRLIALILAAGALCAVTVALGQQAKTAAAAPAAAKPNFPTVLPGKGLAQHDFFYAGEAKTQDMYIVRKGKSPGSFTIPRGRAKSAMPCCFPTATCSSRTNSA
jgi:hypothetical protein